MPEDWYWEIVKFKGENILLDAWGFCTIPMWTLPFQNKIVGIMPDQILFYSNSKPDLFQLSLEELEIS